MEMQARPGRGRTSWDVCLSPFNPEAPRFTHKAAGCEDLGVISPGEGQRSEGMRWWVGTVGESPRQGASPCGSVGPQTCSDVPGAVLSLSS